jgi:hypothetical protein
MEMIATINFTEYYYNGRGMNLHPDLSSLKGGESNAGCQRRAIKNLKRTISYF